jgi:DNA-binding MarR family transcriptional regulator
LNVRSVLSRLEKHGARQTRRSFQDRHQSSAVITACGRALLEELDPNVLRTYEILLSSSSTLLFVARVM